MKPLAAFAVVAALASPVLADPVTIRLSKDNAAIEVVGLATADEPTAAGQLRVVVGGGTDRELADRPAVLGTARAAGGVLRFEPRYPLAPGVTYRVTFGDATADLTVPKPDRKPTTLVSAVYPSADTLPENTLRLYLHFSAPMARGGVYQHIRLLRDGKPVAYPFLELDEELWSTDGTRFTLLFDPGRVKRGLKPREELGPSLEEGKTYTLAIDRAWQDENGVGLKESYRKTFKVGPPDDAPIDPDKWQMSPPKRDARRVGPLAVTFDKPLDHALLHRMVWVVGPDGKRVAGEVRVGYKERTWSFATPGDDWPAGEYQLVIDTRLEDPCGNRVGEAFEVDAFKPVTKKIEGKTVERRFVVK